MCLTVCLTPVREKNVSIDHIKIVLDHNDSNLLCLCCAVRRYKF